MTNSVDAETAALARSMLGASSRPNLLVPENTNGQPTSQNGGLSGEESGDPTTPATGEGADGNQGLTGDGDDPLAALKPEDLLKHPVLGPQLQSWADKAAQAQIQSYASRNQAQLANSRDQIRAEVEEESYVNWLQSLSPEERATEFAENPEGAAIWGKWAQKNNGARTVSPEEIQASAQVYAYAVTIQTTRALMDSSDLPDAKKAELDPQKYVPEGPAGLVKWQTAVHQALIDHAASKAPTAPAQKPQTQQKPGLMGKGTNARPTPQVVETKTQDLFEFAFRNRPADGVSKEK